MSSSTVQKIKERLSIVDVISSYITIEKSGANFKARCPFHNEKTPSFFISPERDNYYCFGCGVKGDIFTFVQEFEGIDFINALKQLASKANVPLEDYNGEIKNDPKEILYLVMDEATKFFQENLKTEKETLLYLKNRKLSIETLRDWRLGFAKNDWRLLKNHLKSKGFSERNMLDAGLIKENEKAGESYDRFRGRIMFPIFDSSGKVNAFSGRVVNKDDEPKYLNSPETVLFDKSKSLYGFHIAKHTIREMGYAILVEGQMDLLMSHQAGFKNTVASSGTALTASHIEIIKRLTDTILIAYDADNAGRNATFRAWKLALKGGLEVKVVCLPDKLDPADAIAKDQNIWKEAVLEARDVIDYFIEIMNLSNDTKSSDKIIKEKILPLIKSIESPIDLSRALQKLSFSSGISENSLREELSKVNDEDLNEKENNIVNQRKSTSMQRALGLLLWLESKNSDYARDYRMELDRIAPGLYESEKMNDNNALVYEIEMHYGGVSNVNQVGKALIQHFEEEILKDEFSRSMERLKRAEAIHDIATVDSELRKCQELSIKISKLSK